MTRSIRKQLIVWLLSLLGIILGARLWWGYYQSVDISDSNFDDQLLSSADSVAARLQETNGVFALILPPDTLNIVTHNNVDSFYYEVFNPDGKRIAGNTSMLGSQLNLQLAETTYFETITLNHEPFRLIQTRVSVPEHQLKSVLVVGAETLHARTHLVKRILTSIAVAQLMVAAGCVIVVVLATNRVFAPLSRLRQSIMNRSTKDLGPVGDKAAPEEVQPLIDAINELLDRSRDEIESRKRFVSNAAHQLRTPIAGLKTYSSMGYGLTTLSDVRHVMEKLDTGLDRVSHLVNQLLALARVEHATLAPTDLNDIVSGATAELLDLALEKEVELECLHFPESAIVDGNTTDLWLLTSNLLENSIRYSGPKGKVTVSVYSPDDCVSLKIEDNGRGIPVEERERVFERFYRLPGSNGNGCGLGLSIVKEVALAHNANITIDTPPTGQGTLVTIVFPHSHLRVAK